MYTRDNEWVYQLPSNREIKHRVQSCSIPEVIKWCYNSAQNNRIKCKSGIKNYSNIPHFSVSLQKKHDKSKSSFKPKENIVFKWNIQNASRCRSVRSMFRHFLDACALELFSVRVMINNMSEVTSRLRIADLSSLCLILSDLHVFPSRNTINTSRKWVDEKLYSTEKVMNLILDSKTVQIHAIPLHYLSRWENNPHASTPVLELKSKRIIVIKSNSYLPMDK